MKKRQVQIRIIGIGKDVPDLQCSDLDLDYPQVWVLNCAYNLGAHPILYPFKNFPLSAKIIEKVVAIANQCSWNSVIFCAGRSFFLECRMHLSLISYRRGSISHFAYDRPLRSFCCYRPWVTTMTNRHDWDWPPVAALVFRREASASGEGQLYHYHKKVCYTVLLKKHAISHVYHDHETTWQGYF